MNEAMLLKTRVEQAWLQFEKDGSIQTYITYRQLAERLEGVAPQPDAQNT